jgi:hypothetical protein
MKALHSLELTPPKGAVVSHPGPHRRPGARRPSWAPAAMRLPSKQQPPSARPVRLVAGREGCPHGGGSRRPGLSDPIHCIGTRPRSCVVIGRKQGQLAYIHRPPASPHSSGLDTSVRPSIRSPQPPNYLTDEAFAARLRQEPGRAWVPGGARGPLGRARHSALLKRGGL